MHEKGYCLPRARVVWCVLGRDVLRRRLSRGDGLDAIGVVRVSVQRSLERIDRVLVRVGATGPPREKV